MAGAVTAFGVRLGDGTLWIYEPVVLEDAAPWCTAIPAAVAGGIVLSRHPNPRRFDGLPLSGSDLIRAGSAVEAYWARVARAAASR